MSDSTDNRQREIPDPFAAESVPERLRKYDLVTGDEYLRTRGVSDAALHRMNLGSTPVARFRSFLDVLYENAVGRELRRRAGIQDDELLKIEGGNDKLPRAFADRLAGHIEYARAVQRIEHFEVGKDPDRIKRRGRQSPTNGAPETSR